MFAQPTKRGHFEKADIPLTLSACLGTAAVAVNTAIRLCRMDRAGVEGFVSRLDREMLGELRKDWEEHAKLLADLVAIMVCADCRIGIVTSVSASMPSEAIPSRFVDPAALPDVYAMYVDGNCLEPDIPDGTCVMFDRRAPYGVGDFVAIYRRPEIRSHPRGGAFSSGSIRFAIVLGFVRRHSAYQDNQT